MGFSCVSIAIVPIEFSIRSQDCKSLILGLYVRVIMRKNKRKEARAAADVLIRLKTTTAPRRFTHDTTQGAFCLSVVS